MYFRINNPMTGEEKIVNLDITEKEYQAWQDGELIQNAAPRLSPAERELLISGLSQESWDELFKHDKDK